MANRRIDSIEIGIGVDLGQLKESLSAAATTVQSWKLPARTINIDVIPRLLASKGAGVAAGIGDPEFQRTVNQISRRMQYQVNKLKKDVDSSLEFKATFVPVQASVEQLAIDAQKILDQQSQGGNGNVKVTVPIQADVASAEAIHGQIQKLVNAQGPIKVRIEWEGDWPPPGTGKGGKGGGGGGTPAKGGGKGKGSGGAATKEPTEAPAAVIGAVVPAAKVKRAKAPVTGAIDVEPAMGRPVKAKASTATGVVTPVTSTKIAAAPVAHPEAPGAGRGEEIAAMLAAVTPEQMQQEAIQARKDELSKKGLIFAPGNKLGLRKGSTYARNPNLLQTEVLDVLQGKHPGPRIGPYAMPPTHGQGSRARSFRGSGFGGAALRLADTRTFEPRTQAEVEQELQVIWDRFKNERAYAQEHPESPWSQYLRAREQQTTGAPVAPEVGRPVGDTSAAGRFEAAAQFLSPFRSVVESMAPRAGKLTDQDLGMLYELVAGDPTKIPLFLETTTKKGKTKRKQIPWPTMLSNPGDPNSEAVTPNLQDALRILRVGDPRRFFKNTGGTKSISRTTATGETQFVSPESTALVTGLFSLLGGTGEQTSIGPVGGIRGLISTDSAIKARRQASAQRRQERAHYAAIQGKPEKEQIAYILKNFPDYGLTEDSAKGFLSQKLIDWAPKRMPRRLLGGPVLMAGGGRIPRKGGKIARGHRMADYMAGAMSSFDKSYRATKMLSTPQGRFEAMRAAESLAGARRDRDPVTLGDLFAGSIPHQDRAEWRYSTSPEMFSNLLKSAGHADEANLNPSLFDVRNQTRPDPRPRGRRSTTLGGYSPRHYPIKGIRLAYQNLANDVAQRRHAFAPPPTPQEPGFLTRDLMRNPKRLPELDWRNPLFGDYSTDTSYVPDEGPDAMRLAEQFEAAPRGVLGLSQLGTSKAPFQSWSRNQLGGFIGRRKGGKIKRNDRIDAFWPRINRDIVGKSILHAPQSELELISDYYMDRGIGLGPGYYFDPNRTNDIPGALDLLISKMLPKPNMLGGHTRVGGGWISEAMRSLGMDPKRLLNDIDIADPRVRKAVMNDPSINDEQRNSVLRSGSAKLGSRGAPKLSEDPYVQSLIKPRKRGGQTREGTYLVGEAGPEIFVPESAGWIIPHHLMDQLPKRKDGGDVYPSSFNVKGKAGGFQSAVEIAKTSVLGGNTARVFIVNWPPSMTMSGGMSGGMGGGGSVGGFGAKAQGTVLTTHERAVNKDMAKQLGDVGASTRKMLDSTPVPPSAGGGGGRRGGGKKKGTSPEAEEPPVAKGTLAEELEREIGIRGKFAIEDVLPGVRASITAEQGKAAARALSTSTGEAAMYRFGGREEIVSRARAASSITNFAGYLRNRRQGLELEQSAVKTQIDATKAAGGHEEELAKLVERHKELGDGIKVVGDAEDEFTERAIGLSKNITGLGATLKATAANTLGIVGGMTLFTAAMSGAQVVSSGLEKVVGPLVERYSGFYSVTSKILDPLTDQERQLNGNTKAAIAATAAHAGLSDAMTEELQTAIKSRVENEAGAKALKDQIDLIHMQVNIQSGKTGPLQPAGGIPGLTRSTGGIFGTPLGATPSMMELINLERTGGVNVGGINSIVNFMRGGVTGISPLMNGPSTPELTNGLVSPSSMLPGGMSPLEFGVRSIPVVGPAYGLGRDLGIAPPLTADTRQQESFNLTVQTLNENAKKAGSSLALMKVGTDDATKALREASEAAMISAGESADTAKQYSDAGLAIVNVTKEGQYQAVDRTGLQSFLQASGRGGLTQTPKQMLDTMQRGLDATIRDIDRRTQFAVTKQQPAEYALQRIAQPLVPYAEDPRIKANQQLLKGSKDLNASFKADQEAAGTFAKQYENDVNQAQSVINNRVEEGTKLLQQMGVPQATINRLGYLGKTITQINKDLTQRQTNITVAEYSNQIRIANRSLKDAKDIWAGIHGSVGSTYGLLEGMNIKMSRQLQLLGFELQQRQINFSVATAGFVAPGTTPEERAARIAEAKVEADYAQKQLDLQRQIATGQYAQTGISAGRSQQDLQMQVELMQAGRSLVQQTNAAQAAIEKLSEERGILLEQAQTFLGGAISKEQVFLDVLKTIETETGPLLNAQVTAIAGAWTSAAKTYRTNFLDPIMRDLGILFPTYQSLANRSGYNDTGSRDLGRHAPGFYGTVGTPTTMTVGEAGSETVAILRNPRTMTVGMGGTSESNGPIQIIFNNPVVRDETDIQDIIVKVEAALMKKTSLFGLRRA